MSQPWLFPFLLCFFFFKFSEAYLTAETENNSQIQNYAFKLLLINAKIVDF